MTDKDLETALGYLWASFIRGINIDLCNHKIFIDVVTYKGDEINEEHSLIFEGVSAFLFVNGVGEKRLRMTAWEKAEISEMHYFKDSQDKIAYLNNRPNFPSYSANINFYIEIWSSLLLIEAKAVQINGVRYNTD